MCLSRNRTIHIRIRKNNLNRILSPGRKKTAPINDNIRFADSSMAKASNSFAIAKVRPIVNKIASTNLKITFFQLITGLYTLPDLVYCFTIIFSLKKGTSIPPHRIEAPCVCITARKIPS